MACLTPSKKRANERRRALPKRRHQVPDELQLRMKTKAQSCRTYVNGFHSSWRVEIIDSREEHVEVGRDQESVGDLGYRSQPPGPYRGDGVCWGSCSDRLLQDD